MLVQIQNKHKKAWIVNASWLLPGVPIGNPPLFVFSLSDPKQNARSLLTPVSGTVCNALPHGNLGFALYGSFFNHLLIG